LRQGQEREMRSSKHLFQPIIMHYEGFYFNKCTKSVKTTIASF
jgi:hypothetical protein